eukprot:9028013-Lingulodinium_polyedra.AAC.1
MLRVAGRGGSPALGWALVPRKDPAHLACGTLKRWAKEWWQATDPSVQDQDALGPSELSRAFHA